MLYIYTSKEIAAKTGKTVVSDVEAFYLLRYNDIVATYESCDAALTVLTQIEGVTEHKGAYIEAKFGAIPLRSISTGGKGSILAVLYNTEFVVSTDEMGYNCIYLLWELSKSMDIFIYTSCEYTYLPANCVAYVNDQFCKDEETVMFAMEEAYE